MKTRICNECGGNSVYDGERWVCQECGDIIYDEDAAYEDDDEEDGELPPWMKEVSEPW